MPKLTRLWPAMAALALAALTLNGRAVAQCAFERRVAFLLGIDARLARELLATACGASS